MISLEKIDGLTKVKGKTMTSEKLLMIV